MNVPDLQLKIFSYLPVEKFIETCLYFFNCVDGYTLAKMITPEEITTMLLEACEQGNAGHVRWLLKLPSVWFGPVQNAYRRWRHFNIDTIENISHIAFTQAIENGHHDVVELLVDDGRFNPAGHDNLPISRAIWCGSNQDVRCLMKDKRVVPTQNDIKWAMRWLYFGKVYVMADHWRGKIGMRGLMMDFLKFWFIDAIPHTLEWWWRVPAARVIFSVWGVGVFFNISLTLMAYLPVTEPWWEVLTWIPTWAEIWSIFADTTSIMLRGLEGCIISMCGGIMMEKALKMFDSPYASRVRRWYTYS